MSSEEQEFARELWCTGHHSFFAVTQALVITLAYCGEMLAARRTDEAIAAIETAISLMDASAVIMRRAGSFSSDVYEDHIRPSMMKPSTEVDLSGLMSADHQMLVTALRSLSEIPTEIAASVAPALGRLRSSFSAVYEAHKFVCARFTDDAPSIWMSRRSQSPAVHSLAAFKARRLALIDRLVAPPAPSTPEGGER